MKKATLIKQGKYWKLNCPDYKNPLNIPGGFNLSDDLIGKEVEFDNSDGGKVNLIICEGKQYLPHKKKEEMGHNLGNKGSQKKNNAYQSQRGTYDKEYSQKGGGKTFPPARTPYNFVPLNETVISTDSGEVNFSEFKGLSGFIEVEVRGITPLFIKGTDGKFFRINDKPHIPGSSLRGMIQNLVEIVSYSKMNQFDDLRLYKRTVLKMGNRANKNDYDVSAGFLFFEDGKYKIRKARFYYKKQIFDYATHLYKFDSKGCTFSVGQFARKKPDVWRFELLKPKEIEKADGLKEVIASYQLDKTRSESVIDLILSLKKGLILNGKGEKIDGNHSFLKEVGIPVFYRVMNGKIKSIGHAKYHRAPYDYTISEHAGQKMEVGTVDFRTSIFGTDKKSGKVFFEDLQPKGIVKDDLNSDDHPKILSSPKPTSYQLYLKQPEDENLTKSKLRDWSDKEAKIRGYKKYWHKKVSSDKKDPNTWRETAHRDKIGSSHPDPIRPLAPNAIFEGHVRFENLTKNELGVLLFALDLPDGCAHKLGMGKPLGLGSVRIFAKLSIISRDIRYKMLFNQGGDWITGETNGVEIKQYKDSFAQNMGERTNQEHISDTDAYWDQDTRMQILKELLTLEHKTRGVSWENRTRSMYIEHPTYKNHKNRKLNEFDNSLSLPIPSKVVDDNTYQKD